MRAVRVLSFVVLAVLIALSAFVGQIAFRMDRTLLRHDFVQAELDSWLAPLEVSSNHQQFTGAMMNEIRGALGWNVPGQLQSVLYEAAAESFPPERIESFVRRTHTAGYRLMRGDQTPVRLTLSLSSFTNRVASRLDEALPPTAAQGVAAGLAQVPNSIDLWEGVDESVQERITVSLRRIPVYSLLLQYAVPGLFIALTLVFRRPGSAMVAAGGGLTGGAAIMLIYIGGVSGGTAAAVARGVRAALPSRPAWIEPPVADTITRALASGAGFAWLLAATGVVLAALGVIVVRCWHDSLDPLVGTAREALRDR